MSKKLYGIKEPKLVDYLLSIVLSIISISSLLVGIWITATKSWAPANASIQSFVDAICFRFQEGLSGVLAAQSILIYGGFVAALTICFRAICQKEYRAITGSIAVAIAGVALAFGVGFFANFVNLLGFGVFVVALALFMFSLLYATKKAFKIAFAMTLYSEECDHCECGEECSCGEEETEVVEEKQPENKRKPKEFVFENSNGYGDTYRQDFEDYNEQVKEIIDDKKDVFDRKENNYTFEQKLKMSDKVAKGYYKELKKYFEGLGFKAVTTKAGETFVYKNKKHAMIDVAGKRGLKVYFKLDIADYNDSPIPVKYKGDVKKYENVPVLLVVKSNLALKRAKKLMEDVKIKFGV